MSRQDAKLPAAAKAPRGQGEPPQKPAGLWLLLVGCLSLPTCAPREISNGRSPDLIGPETENGPLASLLKAYSVENGCAIVAGFPEKAGTKLYNSAILVNGAKGRVYRKTHLFGGEKKYFAPGETGFWIENVKEVKVGVMICFDWFFPESARTLALKGAEVIAHPSNLVLPWGPEGMKIRSLENRVFSATANRVGVERGLRFIGQSQIVSPNGSLLARLGHDLPAAAVVTIDAWTAKDKKVHPACDLFKDRRPRFYGR